MPDIHPAGYTSPWEGSSGGKFVDVFQAANQEGAPGNTRSPSRFAVMNEVANDNKMWKPPSIPANDNVPGYRGLGALLRGTSGFAFSIVLEEAIRTDKKLKEKLRRKAIAEMWWLRGTIFDPTAAGWRLMNTPIEVANGFGPCGPSGPLWFGYLNFSDGTFASCSGGHTWTVDGDALQVVPALALGAKLGAFQNGVFTYNSGFPANSTVSNAARAANWQWQVGAVDPLLPLFGYLPGTQPVTRPIQQTEFAPQEPEVPPRAFGGARPGQLLRPTGPTGRKPPGPRTKEKKSKTSLGLHKVVKYLGDATEYLDLLDAAYDSIDPKCREKYDRQMKKKRKWDPDHIVKSGPNKGRKGGYVWEGPGNPEKTLIKGQAVYRCARSLDMDSLVFNVVWQQLVEDFIWAQLGISSKVRGGGSERFGGATGANSLLGKANAKPVANLLKDAEAYARQRFEEFFGVKTFG